MNWVGRDGGAIGIMERQQGSEEMAEMAIFGLVHLQISFIGVNLNQFYQQAIDFGMLIKSDQLHL